MTIYDGTDVFTGNNVTGAKLDSVSMWHGTTLPTAGSNQVPANGLFFKTDSGLIYENTGTLASPTWTQVSSSGVEFNEFTSATTWNPSKQTGLGIIDIDTNNMTSGEIKLVIDGTSINTLSKNETLSKFINPSSSVALTTQGADYSYSQFSSSGLYNFLEAGGYTQYTWQEPKGIWFNDDGTKFYYAGKLSSPNTLHVFENSVSSANAWNFTTANDSYNGKSSSLPSTPFNSYYSGVAGLEDGGTKMYYIDRINNSSGTGNAIIYRFDWSTGYDATTCATSASNTWTVNDFSGQQIGMGWNSDGTKLFIYNRGNDTLYRYSLSTAWDLSTESLDSGQTKSGIGLSGFGEAGIKFSSSGTKMYARIASGNYAKYRTWTLSTAFDVTTLSTSYTEFNAQGNGGQYGYYSLNGNTNWITHGKYDFIQYNDYNGYTQKINETYGGNAYSSLT